jgi:hypothetical protein
VKSRQIIGYLISVALTLVILYLLLALIGLAPLPGAEVRPDAPLPH